MADVAAVGRRLRRVGVDRVLAQPEELEVAAGDLAERRAAARVVVGRPAGHVDLGAGHQRGAVRDVEDALDERFHVLAAIGADHELDLGAVGDDVRLRPGLGDDPVQADVRTDVLAQRVDPREEQHRRVGGVDAQVRADRAVRGPARPGDPQRSGGEARVVDLVEVARVEHRHRVHPLEGAAVEHDDLAAAALLGRGAQDCDSAGRVGPLLGDGDRGGAGGGADQVVAAAVAEPGERVVLGEQRDRRPVAAAVLPAERGRQRRDAALDREPVTGEEAAEPAARLLLLEADLRVRVDVGGDPLQLGPQAVDPLRDALLQVVQLHRSPPVGRSSIDRR